MSTNEPKRLRDPDLESSEAGLQDYFDSAALPAPEGFAERTMARLHRDPAPAARTPAPSPATAIDLSAHRVAGRGVEVLRWIAIAGAVIVGSLQVAGFAFGLWVTTSAH